MWEKGKKNATRPWLLLIGHIGRVLGGPYKEGLQSLAKVKKGTRNQRTDALKKQQSRTWIDIGIRPLFKTKTNRKKKSCGDCDVLQPQDHGNSPKNRGIKKYMAGSITLDQ
jgi:hypothetical protein